MTMTPDRQLGGTRRDIDTLERTGTPDPRHIQCCVDPFNYGKCGAELDLNTYLTDHPADCPLCFLAEELAGSKNCPRGLGVCP
jgi:hypothetical protein